MICHFNLTRAARKGCPFIFIKMSDIRVTNNKDTYYCVFYDYKNNGKIIREFSLPVIYKGHYISHDFGFGFGEQVINYNVELKLSSLEFEEFIIKYDIDIDDINCWLENEIHYLYSHPIENTIKI
jgi:hypothetical protein